MSDSQLQQPRYTLAEWRAKATELFGDDFMKWKFVCPICEYVASVQDWKDAGAPVQSAAFSCVGRWAGVSPAIAKKGAIGPNGIKGNGPCNYAGGGLFKLNPVTVVDPDGHELHAFAFAEVMREETPSPLEVTAAKCGDALYESMQRPGFEQALESAFAATPEELGAAAVEAARNR